MHCSRNHLARLATIAFLTAIALGVTSPAFGDDWARDRTAPVATDRLDPAIRTAIAASAKTPPGWPSNEAVPKPASDRGFAWGAAALGLAAGIAGMGVIVGSVALVRHDGHLRSV